MAGDNSSSSSNNKDQERAMLRVHQMQVVKMIKAKDMTTPTSKIWTQTPQAQSNRESNQGSLKGPAKDQFSQTAPLAKWLRSLTEQLAQKRRQMWPLNMHTRGSLKTLTITRQCSNLPTSQVGLLRHVSVMTISLI